MTPHLRADTSLELSVKYAYEVTVMRLLNPSAWSLRKCTRLGRKGSESCTNRIIYLFEEDNVQENFMLNL